MATRKTTTGGASAPAKDIGTAAKAATSATRKPTASKATADGKSTVPAKAAKADSAKAPAAGKPATRGAAVITPEQRANYIEVAAFYIAERRGFASGDPMADWLEAQAEIDRAIAKGLLGQR